MEEVPQIDPFDLIRSIKYFTQNPAAAVTEDHLDIIFNKILSQNLDKQSIRCLIKDIMKDIKGNQVNNVDSLILNPSSLNMLINKQLRKHDMDTIFKELFNCMSKNGTLHKKDFKEFFHMCNINIPEDALPYLCKIHLKTDNAMNSIDYSTFIKLITNYLKEKKKE